MKAEGKNSEQDQYWSRILKMTELGNYQTGAIVSRTLIDKPIGNMTFFAFDEGQRLSEHTAPFDALVHILDGEAEITIAVSCSVPKPTK
jgi:quercetin dioxygenase-like cupin family protein